MRDRPGNTIGGATNQASYYTDTFAVTQVALYSGSQNYPTDAGVFSNSDSAYGTFDQAGNLEEWKEAVIAPSAPGGPGQRGLRLGSWVTFDVSLLQSSAFETEPPRYESDIEGFHVATVPEPSTYGLLACGAACLGAHALRRRRK